MLGACVTRRCPADDRPGFFTVRRMDTGETANFLVVVLSIPKVILFGDEQRQRRRCTSKEAVSRCSDLGISWSANPIGATEEIAERQPVSLKQESLGRFPRMWLEDVHESGRLHRADSGTPCLGLRASSPIV